jgi:hypothetical protein
LLIESGTLLLLLGLQNKKRVVEHLEITLQEFGKPESRRASGTDAD